MFQPNRFEDLKQFHLRAAATHARVEHAKAKRDGVSDEGCQHWLDAAAWFEDQANALIPA